MQHFVKIELWIHSFIRILECFLETTQFFVCLFILKVSRYFFVATQFLASNDNLYCPRNKKSAKL